MGALEAPVRTGGGLPVNAFNAGAVAAALLATAWLAAAGGARDAAHIETASADEVVVDANGARLPVRRYARIVSASAVVDRLLVELCEPDRVAAFSEYTRLAYQPYRYAGRPHLPGGSDPEGILAFSPDLVLGDNVNVRLALARVRELGIPVFDIGRLTGVEAFLLTTDRVGRLLGRRAEAAALARRFLRSFFSIADGLPEAERKPALFLGAMAGNFTGATAGTSVHEVLVAAGLRDVAARHFSGWPRYAPETLLELDPEILVIQDGQRAAICATAGLGALRACGPEGRVVELPEALLLDAGLGMLDAALALHEAVYGASDVQGQAPLDSPPRAP